MELLFTKKTEKICGSVKRAKKALPQQIVIGLFAVLNTLRESSSINDVICNPTLHFHALHGNLEGYFSIDIKGRKSGWRLILELLDKEARPFDPCHIDIVAPYVKVIRIEEVSNHYE